MSVLIHQSAINPAKGFWEQSLDVGSVDEKLVQAEMNIGGAGGGNINVLTLQIDTFNYQAEVDGTLVVNASANIYVPNTSPFPTTVYTTGVRVEATNIDGSIVDVQENGGNNYLPDADFVGYTSPMAMLVVKMTAGQSVILKFSVRCTSTNGGLPVPPLPYGKYENASWIGVFCPS